MTSQLLTVDDVAARLRVSRRSVFAMVHRGEFIAPVRLGARLVRFAEADLERWIEERRCGR